ncbi:ribosomal protein S5-alanine N-acetyltransferase [Aliivibrio fischeri]|uniref:ribosomal protein S5-alanine N-acetyltransferase n=1 Tax=Aliivibrio fischeri TaxID=668 RepID=UPI001F45B0D4|nr:ribosomal protein S5-alanine N-acetyltransferase [Aliivibrio fischeri]MCE7555191.1 ribosomal protein S5-alanine N-acetyltransferase [Aliivibrio fischeri]MCE7562459.1 ribosomal protein S5-alanine N-acetyltransferase [Aliivibrio fischeri]MCE7569867.1 ribosomal protein S5-alanine N-acetyltransferase [Aliivibrio fischeri]
MDVSFEFEHYQVRLIKSSDAVTIANYFMRNRHHLAPWEPKRSHAFFTPEGWKQRLLRLVELHKHNLAFYFVVVDKNEHKIIGTVSYSNITRFPFHAGHVGYSLDSEYQGKGIMRRAVNVTVDWMFKAQNLHRIMAAYIPRNEKSAKVLAALGFVKEGEAKKYLYINGAWEDHILTSKINDDWKPE